MSRAPLCLFLGTVILASTPVTVHAGPIDWSISSFAAPGTIRPDHPVYGPFPLYIPFPWFQPGVQFQNTSGNMTGSSHVVLENMTTTSFAPPGTPDGYGHQPFQLVVGILDAESNRSKIAVFNGTIDGTASTGSANLRLAFADPIQSLHIGSHWFRIDINAIVSPGAPGGGAGSIGAYVTVSHNPEPSTLILAGVGVVVLGIAGRRRPGAASR